MGSVYPVGAFQGRFLILCPPSFWRKSKARVSCVSLSFSGLDMVCIAWSLSSVSNPNIIFYQVWVFPPRYFLNCSGWWFGVCMCWPGSLPTLHKTPVFSACQALWILLVVADMLFISGKKDVSAWLCWLLHAACGIFSCGRVNSWLCHGASGSLTRDQTQAFPPQPSF